MSIRRTVDTTYARPRLGLQHVINRLYFHLYGLTTDNSEDTPFNPWRYLVPCKEYCLQSCFAIQRSSPIPSWFLPHTCSLSQLELRLHCRCY